MPNPRARRVPPGRWGAPRAAVRRGGNAGAEVREDLFERLVMVFMMNQLPNRTDVMATLPTLVYQALVAPHAAPAFLRR